MEEVAQYPLYGTTYTVYKLSPLYHGNLRLLNDATLQLHSRRMRNALKGDSIRGVQTGFTSSENGTSSLGPLESCTWSLLGDETKWEEMQRATAQDDMSDDLAPRPTQITAEEARGIHLRLGYANSTHTALLLRDPAEAKDSDGITSLPLLLLRMPLPLREAVLEYLTTTFDTRAASLRLHPEFLYGSLESLLSHLNAKTSTQSIPEVVKSLQIELSFPTVVQHLKHVEITISREDLYEIVRRGRMLCRGRAEESPFMIALSTYLSTHLALRPAHTYQFITKIVCALFILSSDGKLKLLPPSPIKADLSDDGASYPLSAAQLFMEELYKALIVEASPKFSSEMKPLGVKRKSSTLKKIGNRVASAELVAHPRKRKGIERVDLDELAEADDAHTVSSGQTPTRVFPDPPPPYELHDPARVR